MDLCPHHATYLGAMSGSIRGIGYLLNPIIMGFMVKNHVKELSIKIVLRLLTLH